MDAKNNRQSKAEAEKKEFEAKAAHYKKDNWGFKAVPQEIEFPDGRKLQVHKLPSGAAYIKDGDTMIRLTREWVQKQQESLKAQFDKEQADKDNGIRD